MMLAQIMAKFTAPKRSIELISTGSEEGISDGMVQYIVNREKDGTLLDAVAGFNIDMVGVGGPARIVDGGTYPDQPDHQVKHNKELNDFVEEVGKEIGVHLGRLWGSWGTPEEGHLNEHGVPAMCIWKADDPNYHSDNEHGRWRCCMARGQRHTHCLPAVKVESLEDDARPDTDEQSGEAAKAV